MTAAQKFAAFDAGGPHGWVPKAGDRVLFLAGGGPGGWHVTAETVEKVFQWMHVSGNAHWAFKLHGGVTCGVNSLRPVGARK